MKNQDFVDKKSIVREIWSKTDTILFIFAGSAAEFALNKAVDWLYFTGKIPNDPLGRLFSTVAYSQEIIFMENEKAWSIIDKITKIHKTVEQSRNAKIPDWAYRDVLYMLIDYSILSYEIMERKLLLVEKKEVFDVFYRLGKRMELKNLPSNYEDWLIDRTLHLENNLQKSVYTMDLFNQYYKHLGMIRYFILLQFQRILVPKIVKEKLELKSKFPILFFLKVYKFFRILGLGTLIKLFIIPQKYKTDFKNVTKYEFFYNKKPKLKNHFKDNKSQIQIKSCPFKLIKIK
jgi:ER-bound oxygenase mpaB/B'/Rubber oxygenase, catalytic domain